MEKLFPMKRDIIDLTFNISILPNSKGDIIGYIFSFQDLTELHKLKDETKMKNAGSVLVLRSMPCTSVQLRIN